MGSRSICWFRSDLRLADHPALHAACARGEDEVVGVFVVCHEQWLEHEMAAVRAGFLRRTLGELAADLAEVKIPLRILTVDRFDGVAEALLGLADELGAEALYFNREYEINEQRRDTAVEAAFRDAGHKVVIREDQIVLPPGTLTTGTGGPYTVYTPFKKKWLATVAEEGLAEPLPSPTRRKQKPAIESDEVPETIPGFDAEADLPDLWPAGEGEAQRRLAAFLEERGRDYDEQRDLPAVDGTSALSPYLQVGAVSPPACVHAAAEANGGKLSGGNAGLATWIEELIWREFYRNVMTAFPRVCMGRPFREETDAVAWRDAPDEFDAWAAGQTGVPLVDAGMRQLLETGWMHNRVRMVTAMFLTKSLLIDWRLGESHFMRHLIDGDLASNNGGWQWSASTGTDAVPYFRIFNPFSQSKRFDPDGEYIRRFVPELRGVKPAALHDPKRLDAVREDAGYAELMVDLSAARDRAIAAFKAAR